MPPFRLEDWSAPFFSRISPSKGQPVSIRNFDNWIGMLLGQQPENCALSGRCECYSLIEADESVYPCDFYVLDAWERGNIGETSFLRLARSPDAEQFRMDSWQRPKRADAANGFPCVRAAASATERQCETDARPPIGCAKGIICSSKRAARLVRMANEIKLAKKDEQGREIRFREIGDSV